MPDPAAEPAFCLVLHDVAPATWPRCRDFVAEVDALGGVPLTLLVVPDYRRLSGTSGMSRTGGAGSPECDSAFFAALDERVARGDELALHGYHHADAGAPPAGPREWFLRRIYTKEAEFFAIDETEARRRLARGIDLFRRRGWPLAGFVPPAWLLGTPARRALADAPLAWTSERMHLVRLPSFERVAAPSLAWSARSGPRRAASHAWNTALLARTRTAPLLRLGVHPADLAYPGVRAFWLRTIVRLLECRVPLTKSRSLAPQG